MDLPTRSFDASFADVRVEFGLARAEFAQGAANRAAAEQWGTIAEILDEARTSPDVFVDPALTMRRSVREQFAERAAAADIAVRLGLSETTVRAQAFDAETLRHRLPRAWAAFREGEVSVAHARTAAELVRTLPDDPSLSMRFDDVLVDLFGLTPERFRVRARVLRERIHSTALVDRVQAAAETRSVWIENAIDGMAHLSLSLPADIAHRAFARIDAGARSLAREADEQRTLAQLRADVAADILLTTGSGFQTGFPATRVTVAVTVPVLTLLGTSDEPGTLDGYGPIDAETARRLAGHAPSFTRLLTHPVTSALLDIDRTGYRPPADLKRWLAVADQTCRFPGCGRLARNSDIDHIVDHQFGGATRADNLAHLCRHHHRIKHQTRWKIERVESREDESGKLVWTSPTGHCRDADPPPF